MSTGVESRMNTSMYRLILCKVAGTILLAGFLVATSEAVTDDGSQMPTYNAPQNVTPRARLGGNLRSGGGDDPVVAALVPDHVGITVRQHPELNWFLSKHTTLPIRFTLIDERSVPRSSNNRSHLLIRPASMSSSSGMSASRFNPTSNTGGISRSSRTPTLLLMISSPEESSNAVSSANVWSWMRRLHAAVRPS